MINKYIKKRKGAITVLVALMMVVIFGFTALTVDAGIVYVDRRESVNVADAAALAGALELSVGNSASDAKQAAKDTALENGVTITLDDVTVENRNVRMAKRDDKGEVVKDDDGKIIFVNDNRQIVEVIIPKTRELIFAKFIGNDSKDVGARAVATWGYVKKVKGGDILPLFAFSSDYESLSSTGEFELHDGKLIIDDYDANANWGYLDIEKNWSERKELLAGEKKSDHYFAEGQEETGDTGAKQSLIGEIIARIDYAAGLGKPVERQQHLIGLVPIVDKQAFIDDNDVMDNGKYETAPKLVLKIDYFAYYEIEDIVEKSNSKGGTGYVDALHSSEYITDHKSEDYDLPKGSIIGRFLLGEAGKADIDVVMEKGDQSTPNTGNMAATYIKLVQ